MIKMKMELANEKSFNEYAVKMLIDGFVLVQNYDNLIEVSELIHNIGIDINKIAHRAAVIEMQEEMLEQGKYVGELEKPISISDIEKIDAHMQKIWQALNVIIEYQNESKIREKLRKELQNEFK